jgi:GxxExxY protein
MLHENEISRQIIGAAIEVHRCLGPGLLESVYEDALCHEFHLQGIRFQRQQRVPICYKDTKLATDLRLDLLVEDKVVVDLKAKEEVTPVDKSQLLTYLRLCDLRLGLLINFHVTILRDGVTRVVNKLAEPAKPLRISATSAPLRSTPTATSFGPP